MNDEPISRKSVTDAIEAALFPTNLRALPAIPLFITGLQP